MAPERATAYDYDNRKGTTPILVVRISVLIFHIASEICWERQISRVLAHHVGDECACRSTQLENGLISALKPSTGD
jgi:hypothetical protein